MHDDISRDIALELAEIRRANSAPQGWVARRLAADYGITEDPCDEHGDHRWFRRPWNARVVAHLGGLLPHCGPTSPHPVLAAQVAHTHGAQRHLDLPGRVSWASMSLEAVPIGGIDPDEPTRASGALAF